MTIPDRITVDWISTLADARLVALEWRLHTDFVTEDSQERKRSGERYTLLEGPAALVNAWLRWQMVNTEARSRRLMIRRLS